MRLTDLNTLPAAAAEQALLRCCGSTRWARTMAARRPFANAEALADESDQIWWTLDEVDWLEAFAAHPRIGEGPRAAGEKGTDEWSAREQSGVTDDSRQRFLDLNREYEARFGRTFIVCATGKSGAEMLDILERRMLNSPADELREAAEQQRQITRLRLRNLVTDP